MWRFCGYWEQTKRVLDGGNLENENAVLHGHPGAFATGFNDRGAETMMRWFNSETRLLRPELLAGMSGGLEDQMDPQAQIDDLV